MINFDVEDFDIDVALDYRVIRIFFTAPTNGLEKAVLFFRPEYQHDSRGYEDPTEKRLVILRPLASFSDFALILQLEGRSLHGGWLSYLNREVVKFILQADKKSPYDAARNQDRPESLAFPPA
jgi:hypothetical protein